jgi:hypothetical protein
MVTKQAKTVHVHSFVFPGGAGQDYIVGWCDCGEMSKPHRNVYYLPEGDSFAPKFNETKAKVRSRRQALLNG